MPEATRGSSARPSARHLAIDVQAAQLGTGAAVAIYATELLAALLGEVDGEVTLIVSPFAPVPLALVEAAERSPARVRWSPLPLPSGSSCGDDPTVAAAYDDLGIDEAVYLSLGPLDVHGAWPVCSPFGRPRWASGSVVLIHDLAPILLPEFYFELFSAYEVWYRRRLRFCAAADVVLTPTAYLAGELPYCLGRSDAEIAVVGVGPPPGPPVRPTGTEGGVVCSYLPAPHVRPEILIDAAAGAAQMGDEPLTLTFVTTEPERGRLTRLARVAGLGEAVLRFVDPGPQKLREVLGRGPAALVTLGAPGGCDFAVLEAIRAGVTVLAPAGSASPLPTDPPANQIPNPSTPEASFELGDPRSLAELIRRAHKDPDWRAAVTAAQLYALEGSSWTDVSRRLMSVLTPLATLKSPATLASPMTSAPSARVAITGPLPPVPSGISKYIEDQSRVATGRVQVAWVSTQPEPAQPGSCGPPVLDPADVPPAWSWWHHLSNHRVFHTAQLELIAEHGGVVEVHDVSLPFLIPPILVPGPGVFVPADLQAEMRAVFAGPHRGDEVAEQEGIGVLLRWLAARADALVVHSEQARRMLVAHLGDHPTPVHLVPHGSWMSAEARVVALTRRVELPERPYVVVPGFVGPAKWPEGLITALSLVPEGLRPLLVFAGRCPLHLEAKLRHQAEVRGVDLLITGYLATDDFDTWLSRAAASVIGRLLVRGETSGTVLRSARMGTPTIVAASGSISELPDVPLMSVTGLAPSEVARALIEVLTGPAADPVGATRRRLFLSSLGRLRRAFSWEPTLELMERRS